MAQIGYICIGLSVTESASNRYPYCDSMFEWTYMYKRKYQYFHEMLVKNVTIYDRSSTSVLVIQ